MWPADAMWWHTSWFTLTRVMACCLTAPSHYLKQCCSIISGILCHTSESNFTKKKLIPNTSWKSTLLRLLPHLAEANNYLRWRHNERHGISNHRRLSCVLNRLFRRESKKNQSSVSLAFVRGIHRWPVNSPHKGPVTRKMFPFYDVIILMLYRLNPYFRHSKMHYLYG